MSRAIVIEDWFTYGVAVLKEAILLTASDSEQQSLILNTIQEGLLDIANLDNLDRPKIIEAVKEVKEIGVLSEVVFKKKENNKIVFTITTKTILGKNKEEIYFIVTDKESNRTAKWKIGEENIYLIEGWFGTLTVSNKFIRTKPRAHMNLFLRGKQMCLEIDVEKELNDPAKAIQNTF